MRLLRRRPGTGGLVLLYHRIAALRLDPQLLCVSTSRFSEHLEWIAKERRPVSLGWMRNEMTAGRSLEGTIAVTFDDGYKDNLLEAKPILEKFGVPATVFVASGFLGGSREFWWDELERIFLLPGQLPSEVMVPGDPRIWHLGAAAHYDEEASSRHSGWNVTNEQDPTPRHRAYRDLHAFLKPLSPERREAVLDRLAAWSGASRTPRPTHGLLSEEELVELTTGSFVDVGAHTISHPMMATLPPNQQLEEIREGKARLEQLVGASVRAFAYPYGSRSDYTKETVALVKSCGFDLACSNFPGVVAPRTDAYQIPRILVRNWDGEEFSSQISRARY